MAKLEFARMVLWEFRARGWDAVLHGPEVHLVLPWICGLILAVAIYAITRRKP